MEKSPLKNPWLWTALAGAVGAGIGIYLYAKDRSQYHEPVFSWPSDTLKERLKLADVIAFFKTLTLREGVHEPFIASDKSQYFQAMVGKSKPGYDALALCVFNNQNDRISIHRVVYAKGFDQALLEALPEEGIILIK